MMLEFECEFSVLWQKFRTEGLRIRPGSRLLAERRELGVEVLETVAIIRQQLLSSECH